MKKLIMQWHITGRCNKRCSHCYMDDYEMDIFNTNELIKIGYEYISLLKEYNKRNNQKIKGQINITGGEPFIRNDIWNLLDFIKEHNKLIDFSILSNGSLLNEDLVKKLKSYSPRSVQISLDGTKNTHDRIRGTGSYDEVITAVNLLHKYNIKTLISFTANNNNYKEFEDIVKIGRKHKVYKVWTDRMVPIGNGHNNMIDTLSKENVIEYVNIIRREKEKTINRLCRIEIGGERSLQFLNGKSDCYRCSAGDGLIIVLENGDVLPCRRLPIVAGNIRDEDGSIINGKLKDIYFNSKVFEDLRNFKIPPIGCEKCYFLNLCNGGAKCISYGVYGDYKIGDYGCPLKLNNVNTEQWK